MPFFKQTVEEFKYLTKVECRDIAKVVHLTEWCVHFCPSSKFSVSCIPPSLFLKRSTSPLGETTVHRLTTSYPRRACACARCVSLSLCSLSVLSCQLTIGRRNLPSKRGWLNAQPGLRQYQVEAYGCRRGGQ